MRAAVLHTIDIPPVLAEHPKPRAALGQSLVRVTAVPIVPLDLLCASSGSYFSQPALPYVPGVQGVGVVETSMTLAAGTKVWFSTGAGMRPGDGGLAELCAVDDGDMTRLPSDFPDAVAAAVGLSGVAAWMGLGWRGALQKGERVLVLGAGGTVGQIAIGAARALGAKSVVAVARPGRSMERASRAGADAVVPMVGDADHLEAALRDAAQGHFDLVLDPVYGAAATAASRLLAINGRLVNLGSASGETAQFSSSVLRSRTASILGYTNNAISPSQRFDALTAVLNLVHDGQITLDYDCHPLEEVGRLWQQLASGQITGRVVLIP